MRPDRIVVGGGRQGGVPRSAEHRLQHAVQLLQPQRRGQLQAPHTCGVEPTRP